MAKQNKKGDRRGMSEGSKNGLKKAKKKRNDATNRGGKSAPVKKKNKVPAKSEPVVHFAKLIKGSSEQLHSRIRKYVTLIEQEPGAVTATVLAMLMAELDEANDVLPLLWKWVKDFMILPQGDGDEAKPGDPRQLTKLLTELRKWGELLQGSGMKIAEIQLKGRMNPGEPNPLSKYEIEEEEEIGEEEFDETDAVPVSVVDGGEQEGGDSLDVSFLE